jgi:hypothetical protein
MTRLQLVVAGALIAVILCASSALLTLFAVCQSQQEPAPEYPPLSGPLTEAETVGLIFAYP